MISSHERTDQDGRSLNGGNDDNRADPLVYLDTASRQEKHFTMTGKRSQNGMDIGGR